MRGLKYKIGDQCITGQIINNILGQSGKVCVYTTVDNHLRWEYFANKGNVPSRLHPAVQRFDMILVRIAHDLPNDFKRTVYWLTGKSLYHAMNDGLTDDIDTYFRDAEKEIARIRSRPKRRASKPISNKVFIVHGRDHQCRDAVARFVSQLGLEPVILSEQVSKGKT